MSPRHGPVRDETGAIAWLDAPRDLDTLGVADDRGGTWLWGRKDAEVVDRVDWCTMSATSMRTTEYGAHCTRSGTSSSDSSQIRTDWCQTAPALTCSVRWSADTLRCTSARGPQGAEQGGRRRRSWCGVWGCERRDRPDAQPTKCYIPSTEVRRAKKEKRRGRGLTEQCSTSHPFQGFEGRIFPGRSRGPLSYLASPPGMVVLASLWVQ